MRHVTLASLVAGLAPLLSGAGDATAEFQGIVGERIGFRFEGECLFGWRVYAVFDNPMDQLNIVSGNVANPVVIMTDAPDGFFQVEDPTSMAADTPHSQFAVDFLPALAYDTFITIDNTGGFVSDGLTPLSLDGTGGVAGDWNFPTAFGPDSLVLTNAGWRKNPENPDAFATDGRVAIGQFTFRSNGIVSVWGTIRIATVEDGVSMARNGIEFSFATLPFLEFCRGNTNCDLWVDIDDVVNVILDWGTDGSAHRGDVTGDGVTDIDDIVLVIEEFGEPCFG